MQSANLLLSLGLLLLLLLPALTFSQTTTTSPAPNQGCSIRASFNPAPNAPQNATTIQPTSAQMTSTQPCREVCPIDPEDEQEEDEDPLDDIDFGEEELQQLKIPNGADVFMVECWHGEGNAIGDDEALYARREEEQQQGGEPSQTPAPTPTPDGDGGNEGEGGAGVAGLDFGLAMGLAAGVVMVLV